MVSRNDGSDCESEGEMKVPIKIIYECRKTKKGKCDHYLKTTDKDAPQWWCDYAVESDEVPLFECSNKEAIEKAR